MKNIVISFLLLAAFAHPAISMDKETGSYGADSLLVGQDSLSGKFHIKDRLLPVLRRIDRGINTITYVYKNEIAVGIDVSYGTLSSDDTNLMLLLDDLDFKGSVFTVNPSVGYFFRDNMCVGLLYNAKFGYTSTRNELTLALNARPKDWINFGVNYSMLNTWKSLGWILEFIPKSGVGFFIGSDYFMLQRAKLPVGESSLAILPVNQANFNLRFGFHIAMGKNY